MYGGGFAIDRVGDVYLVGRLPLPAVTAGRARPAARRGADVRRRVVRHHAASSASAARSGASGPGGCPRRVAGQPARRSPGSPTGLPGRPVTTPIDLRPRLSAALAAAASVRPRLAQRGRLDAEAPRRARGRRLRAAVRTYVDSGNVVRRLAAAVAGQGRPGRARRDRARATSASSTRSVMIAHRPAAGRGAGVEPVPGRRRPRRPGRGAAPVRRAARPQRSEALPGRSTTRRSGSRTAASRGRSSTGTTGTAGPRSTAR